MAIRFSADIDILVADIVAAGFAVQAIQPVHDSRGRTVDVLLNNEVIVCWDSRSSVVWTEGPRNQMNRVEEYLRKIYEGPKFLRSFAMWRTRWLLRFKSKDQAAAIWLLRSASLPARGLRQLIKCVPVIAVRRKSYQSALTHQR
jgi:hypothetical protein